MSEINKPFDRDAAGEELTWLAFQYLTAELSAEEVERFEARLAVDQAAREALAKTVELYHAVAAAEAEPVVANLPSTTTRRTGWSLPVAWVSVGVSAAAVLLMAGWNAGWFGGSSLQSSPRSMVSPELATAWSEVRSVANSDDDLSDEELAVLTEIELGLDTEAPDWMTAAVLGIAGRSPTGSEPVPLDAAQSRPREN